MWKWWCLYWSRNINYIFRNLEKFCYFTNTKWKTGACLDQKTLDNHQYLERQRWGVVWGHVPSGQIFLSGMEELQSSRCLDKNNDYILLVEYSRFCGTQPYVSEVTILIVSVCFLFLASLPTVYLILPARCTHAKASPWKMHGSQSLVLQ